MDMNESQDNFLRSTSSMSEDICTAVSDDSAGVCGDRTALQILDEFRKLYETRIASIDKNSTNSSQLKIQIMEEWIRDLGAQNEMLVKTVQELELAAYQRVKILEEKLKQTSSLISENMSRFEQPSHQILNNLSARIDILENEGDFLKDKIKNLKNDITGLLELIRRGFYENRWSLDGINLCEISQTDIGISFDCQCEPRSESRSLPAKDLTGDVSHIKSKLFSETKAISDSSDSTTTVDNEMEISSLKEALSQKIEEIERLNEHLNSVEKEATETREALTLEVAEKHDQIIILKDQVTELEEKCRQAIGQLQFKEDVIKDLRMNLKQQAKTKESSPMHSSRSQKSSGVKWADSPTHEPPDNLDCADILTRIRNLKAIGKHQQHELAHAKSELMEIVDALSSQERKVYEERLAGAQKKLQAIENLLKDYNAQNNADDSGIVNSTEKLLEVIEILSRVCMEKGNECLQLEMVLHNLQQQNERFNECLDVNESCESSEKPPNISRDDFNVMEEYRMCTVEAQAATEDLQEEVTEVVHNLDCRHKLFKDLKICVEKTHENVVKFSECILTVIKCLKDHIEEKLVSKKTLSMSRTKLKCLKNEINGCLVNLKPQMAPTTDQEKLTERKNLTIVLDITDSLCNNSLEKVLEEIEYLLCNLQVFITKEDSSYTLLLKCKDELNELEKHLDVLQQHSERVLQDNDTAKNVYEEKSKKLEKLERQLDDAHTRMQDNLEDIIARSERYEAATNSSMNSQESASSSNHCDDSGNPNTNADIKQLRNVVSSKDKLLKHKDEIIQIQKDSINVTQNEIRDMQRRLQKKIDTQAVIIREQFEEKKYLLEQSKLQNETIKHLQNAVVEAKKDYDRRFNNSQRVEKSTVSDVWSPITPTVFNNGDVHDI